MPQATSERIFVLSPCGTSLLTNAAKTQERRLVSTYANAKEAATIPAADRQTLEALVERVRAKLLSEGTTVAEAAKMSAEVNGIVKLYGEQFKPNSGDCHYLLCTDTWLGEQTARLVEAWFKSVVQRQRLGSVHVEVYRQRDLQTKDMEAFQSALSELIEWCEQTVDGYRQGGFRVIFNLTGGFKSVQGFLQTLAFFYGDETVYVFETSDLLRIPRLPVRLVAEETVRDNLLTFRQLHLKLPAQHTDRIPETLLWRVDDQVDLSPWGELVWQRTKKHIYAEKLHPAPSDRIIFSDSFKRSVEGIAKDRLVLVNERIDELARYLQDGHHLQSLDFKPLKGNPCPPSTHELDAWADQDAKRIFGHYEGNCFVLDKLDRGLH
ncbi:CRISPR-associated ring nuclease [Synechococcus sp. PCC 6716]|nr:CRISPR-associated ring nuclease [Synechococcus sp. PCC 6716]